MVIRELDEEVSVLAGLPDPHAAAVTDESDKASALIRCPAEGVVSCLRGGGSNAPLYVCAAAACVETASAGTTPPPATEDVGRTTVLKSNKAGVIRDRARTVRGGMSPEHVFRPLADGRLDAVDHYGRLAGARQLSVRVRNDGGR